MEFLKFKSHLTRESVTTRCPCPMYGTTIGLDTKQVFADSKSKDSLDKYLHRNLYKKQPIVSCKKCGKKYCTFCKEPLDIGYIRQLGKNHCIVEQLLKIILALHYLHLKKQNIDDTINSGIVTLTDVSAPESHVFGPRPVAPGIGYGSDYHDKQLLPEDKKKLKKRKTSLDSMETKWDSIVAECFETFSVLLPDSERGSEMYDYIPHPQLQSILEESCLVDILSEYLTNNAINIVFQKIKTYQAIVKVLEGLSHHEMTVPILTRLYDRSKLGDMHKHWLKMQVQPTIIETEDKMVKCIGELYIDMAKQVPRFIESMIYNNNWEKGSHDYNQEYLDVMSFSSDMERLEKSFKHLTFEKTLESKDETLLYRNVLQDQRIGYTKLWEHASFTLDTSVNVLHIAKELASLETSLPFSECSSIFVRIDETDLRKIRFMITGPKGTPYDMGCLFFTVTFTSTYPATSPQVVFDTTGYGSVRFNPNLYQCGKVCLSLLGTWSGDPWISGKSTLLQVLTSIQACVLVDEPYYNEPGMRTDPWKSKKYTIIVRRFTVKYAMIDILEKPPLGFEQTIRDHFKLKKKDILQRVDEWILEDPIWDKHYNDPMLHVRDASLSNQNTTPASENHWPAVKSKLETLLDAL